MTDPLPLTERPGVGAIDDKVFESCHFVHRNVSNNLSPVREWR